MAKHGFKIYAVFQTILRDQKGGSWRPTRLGADPARTEAERGRLGAAVRAHALRVHARRRGLVSSRSLDQRTSIHVPQSQMVSGGVLRLV